MKQMQACAGVAIALLVAHTAGAEPHPEAKPNTATVRGQASLIGEKETRKCKKVPLDKRVVRFNLEPETKFGDLLAWIAPITCRQFLLPGTISTDTRVTVIAPALITPSEAYRLFLGALESIGLSVERSGRYWRVVEVPEVKTMGGIPLVPVARTPAGGYVTRLIRLDCLTPQELAQIRERFKTEGCHIVTLDEEEALVITDLAENVRDLPNGCDR